MRPRFRTYADILAQRIAVMRVKSGVNFPLYEGDALLSVLEGGSMMDADQYVQGLRMGLAVGLESSSGDELDERLLEQGTPRLEATKATVTGHFTRVVGSVGLLSIAAGTTFFVPATPTTSAIEFTTLAVGDIPLGAPDGPTITAEAAATGTSSNGVPPGSTLTLKSVTANVLGFVTETTSAGGLDRELDDDAKTRARRYPQEVATASKTSLEGASRRIAISGGGAVQSYKVIENFRTGITEIYIDDGSGVAAQIGPTIASQTYRYTAIGGEIYVRAEQLIGITPGGSRQNLSAGFPFITITSVNRDVSPYGAPVAQVLGTDYFVEREAGVFALTVPLAAAERVDVVMTTYGGLVEETAKVIRGIPDNASYPGVRGANMLFQVRPPTSKTTGTVVGTLSVSPGYDTSYSRTLASRNILAYINSQWGPVRFAKLIDIAMDTPGATNFVMTQPTGDISPTNETGVVRSSSGDVQIS